jgi:hypothetical protein
VKISLVNAIYLLGFDLPGQKKKLFSTSSHVASVFVPVHVRVTVDHFVTPRREKVICGKQTRFQLVDRLIH